MAPVGIDRNVRQCYGSNGVKYQLSDFKIKGNFDRN